MKRIYFFWPVLFITITGLISCKDKKQAPGKEVPDQKTGEVVPVPDHAKDSTEIRTVVTAFYDWYGKNDKKFQQYNLYGGTRKKDTPPYKINWDEVGKYQDFIRSSVPQLGEEFLQDQKHFFGQCDSAFKVDVGDDVPYGFDYDWYTNSQEDPQYLLDEINKEGNAWDIAVNGNDATVAIKGTRDDNGKATPSTYISLVMKKEKGRWTIAKIMND